jgi:NADP-dependent 3-hydroxy acid dehydrogenase YdfG
MWNAIDPDSKPGFRKRKDMMRPEDVAEAVLFVVTRDARLTVTEIRLAPTRR